MRSTVWVGLLAVALAGIAADASGQSSKPPVRVWLGLGLATAVVRNLDADAGGTVQVVVQRGAHHAAFRSLSMGDFSSVPDGSDDGVREVGLIYGRAAATSFGYVTAVAGVALVTANGLPQAGESRRTAGLPLVVEAGLRTRVVGLSIQGFGNLNSLSRFAGVAVYLNLGWMP